MRTVNKRLVLWVGGVLAALLVVVIVLLAVLIANLNAQSESASYRACMEQLGAAEVAPGESVEDYAERGSAAAEFCSR